MPIYMDRHDVSEPVTAEDIARIHQEDLKVQAKFGCRGLTYWFDDKRKTAFCLIEAPDAKAIKEMHDFAHGQVPHEIIEVETQVVESFLGRIEDPENKRNTGLNIIDEPAFRTIVVICLNQIKSENSLSPDFTSSFKSFNTGLQKILKSCNGSIVRQTDYYYLVSFTSVTNAVHAAMEVQLLNRDFNRNKHVKFALKIGVNSGVPVTRRQMIFEDTIKLAERMCRVLKGDVILSAEVRDLYKNESADNLIENKNVLVLTRSDEKFLTLLMDYTEHSWSDTGFNANSFVKRLGYSKSQLYRKMISLTGKSPLSFVLDYRLEEAQKLLGKNTGNISEIAFASGFSSPSYFTKCFKKKFGVLPAAILKTP